MSQPIADVPGSDRTDEQIIEGWGNLGPVVVQMRRRIESLENERARNITALVEEGIAVKVRLDALEEDMKSAACAGAVQARFNDIERRLPKPIPVVTPLAPRCPCEDGSLCALVPGSKAHPHPVCYTCGGPVEPERHCYAHPTCYRCLPPPVPLTVKLPRSALVGSITDHGTPIVPAPQPAPSPDYAITEPTGTAGGTWPLQERALVGHEVCGCDEAVNLRGRIAVLERELKASQRAHGIKCDEVFALRALLGRIGVYADTYGKDLVPTGPDSYGEGVRAVKGTLKTMLGTVNR
jgi:hypothetical protein